MNNPDAVADLMYRFFIMAIRYGGPVLLASMAIGIIISILQAATQIHEQTLTFVPKLLVIGIMLLLTGQNIMVALQEFARDIFAMIAAG